MKGQSKRPTRRTKGRKRGFFSGGVALISRPTRGKRRSSADAVFIDWGDKEIQGGKRASGEGREEERSGPSAKESH